MANANAAGAKKKTVPSTRKVTVGTLSGALVAIGVHAAGAKLEPGVESALGTVVAALIFFFVPEGYIDELE